MDKTYSLDRLGITKANISYMFFMWYSDRNDEWSRRVRELLKRRGNQYTHAELIDLAEALSASHHLCVLDHPEEYRHLVRNAKRILKRQERVLEILRSLDG